MRGRLASRIGAALLAAGLVLGGFVVFQLWGTALYEHHQQAVLAARLPAVEGRRAQALAHPAPAPTPGLGALAPAPGSTTPPPPVGTALGYLVIPRIGLDDVIVEGVSAAQLRGGPGHYPGSALPGQAGNAAIAGHRTTYAAPFGQLQALQVGDPIYVLTAQGLFRYDVISSRAVAPTDVAVLDQTPAAELTLTTCTPRYSASQRLVVVAAFHPGTAPPAPAPAPTRPPSRSATAVVTVAGTGTTPWWWAGLAGALVVVLATGFWVLGRRVRAGRRWVVAVVGGPVVLVALVVFYAALSLALPSTY